jgi:hypothetical protein
MSDAVVVAGAKLQISPLRYATVEMTKGRAVTHL